MVGLIIISAIIVLVIFFIVSTYNKLVSLRNEVDNGWSDIDVQLKRRVDLIPNLVETVKGYATHEKETFDAVADARASTMNASTPIEKADANDFLSRSLGKLMAISESYPDLKANSNFLQLQSELTDTEDKISVARRYYNNVTQIYNTKTQTFPNNIIAKVSGFKSREYYKGNNPVELEVVQVSFA